MIVRYERLVLIEIVYCLLIVCDAEYQAHAVVDSLN